MIFLNDFFMNNWWNFLQNFLKSLCVKLSKLMDIFLKLPLIILKFWLILETRKFPGNLCSIFTLTCEASMKFYFCCGGAYSYFSYDVPPKASSANNR